MVFFARFLLAAPMMVMAEADCDAAEFANFKIKKAKHDEKFTQDNLDQMQCVGETSVTCGGEYKQVSCQDGTWKVQAMEDGPGSKVTGDAEELTEANNPCNKKGKAAMFCKAVDDSQMTIPKSFGNHGSIDHGDIECKKGEVQEEGSLICTDEGHFEWAVEDIETLKEDNYKKLQQNWGPCKNAKKCSAYTTYFLDLPEADVDEDTEVEPTCQSTHNLVEGSKVKCALENGVPTWLSVEGHIGDICTTETMTKVKSSNGAVALGAALALLAAW